jgi:hypothetical protein
MSNLKLLSNFGEIIINDGVITSKWLTAGKK